MSGLVRPGVYELTATKALYWHGRERRCCRTLLDVARNHLTVEGVSWSLGRGGGFVIVEAAGLDERGSRLWELIV